MKSLYVTDRRALPGERFLEVLDSLSGAPFLNGMAFPRLCLVRTSFDWARQL